MNEGRHMTVENVTPKSWEQEVTRSETPVLVKGLRNNTIVFMSNG